MRGFVLLFFFVISQIVWGQEFIPQQFSELKGMEDSLNNTHLFYRIRYLSKESETQYYGRNDVFHLNLHNNSDTLKFREYEQNFGGYFETSEYVSDYKFWHNNPDYYIYGGGGGWCGYYFIRRFDTLGASMLGSSFIRLGISNQNDSLVYSSLGVSRDGGRSWPMQNLEFLCLSPFNDQELFLLGSYRSLLKSTDGGLTSFLVDETILWQENDFLFDKDSSHIYALARTHEPYHWCVMVSSKNGTADSWVKVFESSESNDNTSITFDPSKSGMLYVACKNNLYESDNYGNSFVLKYSFRDNIVGIYKKPLSNLMYVALTNTLFAIDEAGVIYPIKEIPMDKQMVSYDPIDKGNRWIYERVDKDLSTGSYDKYLEIKEVVKDTIINNSHWKKISNYFYNRKYHSPISYTYEQIDSVNGYTLFTEDGIHISKGEELYFNVTGEEFTGSRFGIDSSTTLLSVNPYNLFNVTRQSKEYQSINSDSTHSSRYVLTYPIGLTRYIEYSGNIEITKYLQGCKVKNKIYGDTTTIVAVRDAFVTPTEYKLFQNYPNPFNPETMIRYNVSKPEKVNITLYDVLGNEIKVLVNENKNTGSYEVRFNSAGLSSGVYFYRMKAGVYTDTKKMIVLH